MPRPIIAASDDCCAETAPADPSGSKYTIRGGWYESWDTFGGAK